ncbi:hypothetical protein FOA52_007399 [Chlamydomonas sp. UWO 241]|nr:hypothetical protein FOA52_007399 [Chlamydomonas sp. UWO 241]
MVVIPILIAVLLGRYVCTSGEDGWVALSAFQADAQWLVDASSALICPTVLLALAACVFGSALVAYVFVRVVDAKYRRLVGSNTVDVSPWVQEPNGASFASRAKLLFTHYMSAGGALPRDTPVELGEHASTFMPGLRITVRDGSTPDSVPLALGRMKPTRSCKPIVVGTIRMGFGHHRIAYAACSWSVENGGGRASTGNSPTYFHDLLNIDSPEATLVRDMDKMYSKGSRLASEMGGPVEALWGALTMSGSADSLRATYQMAETVKPLLLGLPKDTPIVATHCLVALAAVAAGFEHVINLVIDNYAQWFIVVPGALNLVQGPTNFANLLKMGVPPEELRLVGHWIPRDLVDNIEKDCAARVARCGRGAPLRVLVPVGGAGAQRKFVSALVAALAPRVKAGDVQLWLNAGDHVHMRDAFIAQLAQCKLDHSVVDTMEGVHAFCDARRAGKEPDSAVTLFAFEAYFPAVAATDILCRVTDVLACKPSELAFYPVPKLMIRRVGDHEQFSANRASELGDGTQEARTTEDALHFVSVFKDIPGSPLLVSMNECIVANVKIGVYDGCKEAIEIARSMR